MPQYVSQVVNEYQTLREQWDLHWHQTCHWAASAMRTGESCRSRIRCQGEVTEGEKCQEYCFPAGSGNRLCLCPSALRSKPPWIIQMLFENSHHSESEGSLALPGGKQALVVSSRAKPRFPCSHKDSSSCHLCSRSSLFLLHQLLAYRPWTCGPSDHTGFSRYFASNGALPCNPALMHCYCLPQYSGYVEVGVLRNNLWQTHLDAIEWFGISCISGKIWFSLEESNKIAQLETSRTTRALCWVLFWLRWWGPSTAPTQSRGTQHTVPHSSWEEKNGLRSVKWGRVRALCCS